MARLVLEQGTAAIRRPPREVHMQKVESVVFALTLAICGVFTLVAVPLA